MLNYYNYKIQFYFLKKKIKQFLTTQKFLHLVSRMRNGTSATALVKFWFLCIPTRKTFNHSWRSSPSSHGNVLQYMYMKYKDKHHIRLNPDLGFLGEGQLLCLSLHMENHSLYYSSISVTYPQLHMKISSLYLPRHGFTSLPQFCPGTVNWKHKNKARFIFAVQTLNILKSFQVYY